MPSDDEALDRRGLIRALGTGAVGALLGVGLTGGARAAPASPNDTPASGVGGGRQPVVLYGPNGRPLPTFGEGDPGHVRSTGRSGASGYVQRILAAGAAQTIPRAPAMAGIWVQVESGEVRVRTDGADATPTTGELIGAGFAERYDVPSLSVVATGPGAVVQTWSE